MKDLKDAVVEVIREYPGWTMFCIVIIVLAIAERIAP